MAASAAQAGPEVWVSDGNRMLGRVDVTTGAVTLVGDMGRTMWDIAFDPLGNLFGLADGTALYRINRSTAAATFVGNLGTTLNSLTFSPSGTLYGAASQLYSINTSSGVATLVGSGGQAYNSSGDLAFVGGQLYLSSVLPGADSLIRLNPANGAGTFIGNMGRNNVWGLATSDNVGLFAVAGTTVYTANIATGATTAPVAYGGHGLGSAFGTAFISEAAPVPEAGTAAMWLAGLSILGLLAWRRSPA